MVGRGTGAVRLEVVRRSTRAALEGPVLAQTRPGATVNTDEWKAYLHLPEGGRGHATVCHNPARPGGPEYARDDDGDGVREVHCNTMEGIWTGLRNFRRPFRGVSKKSLPGYVAVFEWAHNAKVATADFLRSLLSVTASTS